LYEKRRLTEAMQHKQQWDEAVIREREYLTKGRDIIFIFIFLIKTINRHTGEFRLHEKNLKNKQYKI